MAKETKSISVSPSEEQSAIELWEKFGWELMSSQEIFNRESHLEESGDSINSVVTTTNYVKLVFSREKTMRNYDKFVQLENEFCSVVMPRKKSAKGWYIFGVLGLLCGGAVIVDGESMGVPIIAGIAGLALGGLLFVLGIINSSKNNKIYNELYTKAIDKKAEILKKAENLLNNSQESE